MQHAAGMASNKQRAAEVSGGGSRGAGEWGSRGVGEWESGGWEERGGKEVVT